MSENKKIEQILEEEGRYVCTTVGVSMMPLLSDRRDNVIVLKTNGRLKKYDVPLYRRGEEYVLHRIIKVLPDSYIIRGDNCVNKEYGITDDDIIGVLHAFYRKDKYIETKNLLYRIYSVLIVAAHPMIFYMRRQKARVVRFLKRR